MSEPTTTAPLRIAYLCLQATTEGQASHAHVHEIIKGLVGMGHSVQLYEPRYAGKTPPRALGRFLEFARIQSSLIRDLTTFDVLYVRGHPLALPAARAAKRAGITTIQECNGPYEDFVQAWPATRVVAGTLAAMARKQFRDADAVTAVTPPLAAWLSRDTGISVEVVPNGANVDLFHPGHPRPDNLPERYAVFFGALQPWQGVGTILSSVLEPDWPENLPIVFAGDGLLVGDVRVAAESHPDRIMYLGRLAYRDVPALVSNASVSLVGFNTEARTGGGGSPVKLYESMACGVAVVAGDLPGQAEVVRSAECGVVVTPITPKNLAETVARLVSAPVAAKAMGERGRAAAVAEHSWAARARQVDQIIAEAVGRVQQLSRALSAVLPAPARPAMPRIAYLSLQAVVEGQDTWAAVNEIIEGFEVSGWSVDRYFPDYGSHPQPSPMKRLQQMYLLQTRLGRMLAHYDAVYVRAHPLAWPLAMLARRKRVPVVQECNGPYEDLFIAWPATRPWRPIFEALQRSQYRAADAVIAVAQGLTDSLRRQTGNRNIVTNGNGANTRAFSPDVSRRPGLPERYAVFFGQFAAWQGISVLLDAATRDDWPRGLHLVFVGDGVLRPQVEQAAKALPDRVIYLGKILYEEVAQVVSHAVVSYVPIAMPKNEMMHSPLKLYESMACGVPVIASDTIGISEVVNAARCGVLVKPGDPDAIVRATLQILADPILAREMGMRGREAAVERYSWRARSRQRREVIEQAISTAAVARTA
jgi:glycosyltransferase involved in cell wall biosynthesis